MPRPDNTEADIDHREQHAQELRDIDSEIAWVYAVNNASLGCAIDCPKPLRTPQECEQCGELSCRIAAEYREKLWQDKP